MDIFPNFRTGWTEMLAFISSSSCCYPFHFLVLVSGWQVKLSSQIAAHPSLCWLHVLNREINNTERGWVLKAVILKEAVTLKKSILTKINNQTNNQTTICSKLQRRTVTWSSLFLLWLLVPQCFVLFFNPFRDFFFWFLFLFFFLFPWITPPSSLISMALWLQAAHLRVEKNSLAMYKKEQVKPKMLFLMSFLYCSLVSFFVTVIIWRFPNCTKLHGN